jgi:hypothetical protein
MTKPAWLHASLRRGSIGLAGGSVLLLVMLGLVVSSQRDWRNRAATLQRENTSLQLTQLAHELTAQSAQLADRARELAQSEAVVRLVQENTDASADRLELADMSRGSVDALLVLTASRAVRFSVTFANGQLSEQPPDPALAQFVESNVQSDGANRASAIAGFTGDRWITARPVTGHAPSNAILGWVVLSRSLSAALVAQLANSVSGSLTAQPLKDFDSSPVNSADSFSATTSLSRDDSSGFIALRDASGRPVRVLRLTPVAGVSGAAFSKPQTAGSSASGYVLAALLVLLAIVAVVLVGLRRYFRHQR